MATRERTWVLIAGILLLGAAAALTITRLVLRDDTPVVTWTATSEADSGTGAEPRIDPVAAAVVRDAEPGPVAAPVPGPEAKRLRGRVVDEFAAPVSGARIFLDFGASGTAGLGARHLRRVPAAAVTGADGTFVFQGQLFERLRVVLHVTHRDHAPRLLDRSLGAIGMETDLGDIAFEAGGEVLGRVTDDGGLPIPGAHVQIVPEPDNPMRWMRALDELWNGIETDGGGALRFDHVATGKWRVFATAPRRQQGQSPAFAVTRNQALALDDIRLAAGHELGGVVVDTAGTPVAAARILVSARGGGFSALSDAQGRFTLDHLPDTPCTVTAEANGYLRFEQRDVVPRLAAAPLQIVLQDGLRIRGVVVDAATGSPVTSYSLSVTRLRGPPDAPAQTPPPAHATPAPPPLPADWGLSGDVGPFEDHAEGRFSLRGLQEGVHVILVQSPDHQRWRSAEIELRARAGAIDITAALARGLSVRGRITDGTGRSLAGAQVELRAADEADGGDVRRSLGLPVASTRSDAMGRFAIEHARAGHYCVVASAQGRDERRSEPFALATDVDGIVLALDALGRLEGRVLGMPDNGDGPARVLAAPVAGLRTVGLGRATRLLADVGADGSYHIDDLAAGGYRVRAFFGSPAGWFAALRDGEQGTPADVVVRAGATSRFDVQFAAIETGTLQGVVTDNGLRAEGFGIHLRRVDGGERNDAGARRGSHGGDLGTVTDAGGAYVLRSVPAGHYEVAVTSRGGAVAMQTREVTVVVDRPSVLDFALVTGEVRGRVTAADGSAAADLQGGASFLPGLDQLPADLDAWRACVRAAVHDGAFCASLAPGPYLVVLEMHGRQRVTRSIYLGAGQRLDLDLVAGARQ
ncbi:MAG TPA: carboxypeptidase-like regulatory domain-containing protein [Planctomycetota bacterium]|nr:carboxypeptidase-like regulatory domain-containing protein [Planctomycetota bacterium]